MLTLENNNSQLAKTNQPSPFIQESAQKPQKNVTLTLFFVTFPCCFRKKTLPLHASKGKNELLTTNK